MGTQVRARQSRARRKQQTSNPSGLVWLLIGVSVFVIGLALVALRGGGGGTGIGSTPDFSATTLTGETVQLSAYRGQVVMLNFWATWCPPCRAEMPTIDTAYRQYGPQGFTVLAVNNGETPDRIAPFAQALGLRIPLVLDTNTRIQRQFAIEAYPTSIFIGRDGAVYATHVGIVNPSQLTQYIETGLAQPAPAL
jgi:thiol-disulfide isomerase/thioredoxin